MLSHFKLHAPHLRSLLVALGLVFATAACDGNAPDPSQPLPPGNYPLVQVETISNLNGGGSGVPVTFSDGGGNELTFHDGSLELQSDGLYELSLDLQFNSLTTTIDFTGVYEQNGSALSFVDDDDPEDNMSASSNEGRVVAQHNDIVGMSFRLIFDI